METKSKTIEKVSKPEATPVRDVVSARQTGNSVPHGAYGILDVQRAAGNLAVQQLARLTDSERLPLWAQVWRNSLPPLLQMQSSLNQEENIYEQEADIIAELLVREDKAGLLATDGKTNGDGGEEERISPLEESTLESEPRTKQRRTGEAQQTPHFPPAISEVFRSGSDHPLETAIRSSMEEFFGADFSGVRVHTGIRAAQSAQAVHALAYTVGHNIVFDTGQYAPETVQGRRLLAHELTHVAQQQPGTLPLGRPTPLQRAPRGGKSSSLIPLPKGRPVPPLSDEELLRLLEAYPKGKTITLYHVDETGDMIKQVARDGRITLKEIDFWLSTTVERRTGFKQGAGLETILALELDARFAALISERAMRPRLYGIRGGRTFQKLFGVRLPIPKYHFEGGGRKQGRALEGTGEVNISIPPYREWTRLLNLSLVRADHLRYDPSLSEGKRLVQVQQLIPQLPPAGGPTSPPGVGPATGISSGGSPPSQVASIAQPFLKQLSEASLQPLLLSSYAELHDPQKVEEITSRHNGYALLNGVVYRLSIRDNKLVSQEEIMPHALALSLSPPLTGQTSFGRAGSIRLPEPPGSYPTTEPPVLNLRPAGKVRIGRTSIPPSTTMMQVGDLIILGGETEWYVADAQTREPIAAIFSGGMWYRLVKPDARSLVLDEQGQIIPPQGITIGGQRLVLEPIYKEATSMQTPRTGLGAFRTGPGFAVGTASSTLAVLAQITAPIAAMGPLQRNNILTAQAEIEFWTRFGAQPTWGIWDERGRKVLDYTTLPRTGGLFGGWRGMPGVIFDNPYYPYVADINADSFKKRLTSQITTYQFLISFLELAKQLGAIIQKDDHYFAVVNKDQPSPQKFYDITDTIEEIRTKTLSEGNEQMRAELRKLSPSERGNIFRLKSGSNTRLYRTKDEERIENASQFLGPDPWVRKLGPEVGGGVLAYLFRHHFEARVLVAPANGDALRAAVNSEYTIKKSIEDVLDEVKEGNRPIYSQSFSPLTSRLEGFVAGPADRFGTTRYQRDLRFPTIWTKAIGELKKFYVNANELVPIAAEQVIVYIEGPRPNR